jgi:YVTN family beta-propeller protein
MPLKIVGTIAIPSAAGSEFDHASFDAKSRRVFIAHTARDSIEVIDHDAGRHIATLPGFPGAAGAVADDGQILVTNRGSASIALLDARTLETRATYKTGGRPNGAVIVARSGLGIAACIGVDGETPTLQLFGLKDRKHVSIDLPGRPRWCVTDAAAERLFHASASDASLLLLLIATCDFMTCDRRPWSKRLQSTAMILITTGEPRRYDEHWRR